MKTRWDGVGDRMRRNRGWGHAHHPTKLEGTYSLCHYSERSHLKTQGTLSLRTLVFEEEPDELSGSLTMLDLWLSAKIKAPGYWGKGRGAGNPLQARPDLHPSQRIVHNHNLPTTWYHQAAPSPFPPSLRLPAASSLQQWRKRDVFEMLG